MDISFFTPAEDAVLLGLLRVVIKADGDYSLEEQSEMRALKDEMGDGRFEHAVRAAEERFPTTEALKEHARTVNRPEVRTEILRRLLHVAAIDGVDDHEERPLRWLARAWPDAELPKG